MLKHKYFIISGYITTTKTPFFLFTNDGGLSYINEVVAKSTSEPENSSEKPTANTSTPINNRAFFVCCIHTSKEKAIGLILSMVTWSGKGLALCYYPLVIVSQTVSRYRQILRNKAVTFNTSTNGGRYESY